MQIKTYDLPLETDGHGDMRDVTHALQSTLGDSGLTTGTLTAFVPGSTAALTTIEYEDGALQDFRRLFEEIAAEGRTYQHNLRWGDGNGHSHVRAALLGPSLTIPFQAGTLRLGTWQQVILVDFDNRPRQRTLVLTLMGI
jgi:secondary thiamine-phosphate synthase enzyme